MLYYLCLPYPTKIGLGKVSIDISNLTVTFWRNAVDHQNGRWFPLPHTMSVTWGGSTLPEILRKYGEELASVDLYDIIRHSTWFLFYC
jgi:hypothetical protein